MLTTYIILGFCSVEVLNDWALPTVVQKGDKVDLRCNFELSGENMYSLKWYRDNVEFYRYIPSGGLDIIVLSCKLLAYLFRGSINHCICDAWPRGAGLLNTNPHHPQQCDQRHQWSVQVRGIRRTTQVFHSIKDYTSTNCWYVM